MLGCAQLYIKGMLARTDHDHMNIGGFSRAAACCRSGMHVCLTMAIGCAAPEPYYLYSDVVKNVQILGNYIDNQFGGIGVFYLTMGFDALPGPYPLHSNISIIANAIVVRCPCPCLSCMCPGARRQEQLSKTLAIIVASQSACICRSGSALERHTCLHPLHSPWCSVAGI